MNGQLGMGTLNVYIRSGGQEELMLSLKGNHGNQWKAGHVELSWIKPYQVGDCYMTPVLLRIFFNRL